MRPQEVALAPFPYTVIVWENVFARDCFARCLRYADSDCIVACFSSVQEWVNADERRSECVVLLCATGRHATEAAVRADLAVVKASCVDAQTIIVSDVDLVHQMVEALESGAMGYIPMSLSLDVSIEAIHLVRAGGTFVPAGALLASSGYAPSIGPEWGPFTERQIEVIRAIRLGKPNKIIAHELNMGECTVKVHIRNIMRILKAKNRTEVAYLTNDLFSKNDEDTRPEVLPLLAGHAL